MPAAPAAGSSSRRAWIERAGAQAPRAPMWTSRGGWLTAVSTWAHAPGFAACCESGRVSVTPATVLAVARVMADHADHATGRHCAVTRATIAERIGCDPQTVTRVWRVLRVAGWAIEAQRGHGSANTPAVGRRPSVYHLVPRRSVTPVVHIAYLPPKAGSCSLTPVGSSSPSAHGRAGNLSTTGKRHRRQGAEPPPRPLPVQRLAAMLVRDCHGLDRGHVGGVCDAITAAGIDPAVWSARAIRERLDADMHNRRSSWPDRIDKPGAFLASRLRRLEWQPEGPLKGGGYAAASPDNNQAALLTAPPATAAQRAEHRARIDAVFARRGQRRTGIHTP